MKIAIINTYSDGSTGTIAKSIGDKAMICGNEVRFYYGRKRQKDPDWIFFGENKIILFFSNLFTFMTGKIGSFHKHSTKRLIKRLKEFAPDVVHLHNIHGNYLNFDMLYKYLSKENIKVVFTLHDEFLLTGRCALCFCDKWKNGCHDCKFLYAYPHAMVDRCGELQLKKASAIKQLDDCVLVTPSLWLKKQVESSLLSSVRCECINNGIATIKQEEFDLKNIIAQDKINVLFAAHVWSRDKGAFVVKEINEKIDKNKFNIIVCGVDKYCEDWFGKNYKKVGVLERNQLAYLLHGCDVFVNPTYKDNYPTILIESLQVGTPAITFDTGGCSEIVDETCGVVLKEKTSNAVLKTLENFVVDDTMRGNCVKKSLQFSDEKMAERYLSLYESIIGN